MPLPIGHATIGFTIHGLCDANESGFCRWKPLLGILILSNLPDVDVVLGIVFHGNGNVFHRGPTHSLIFALIGGFLVSRVWKLWSQLPRFSFRMCLLLILSHIVADFAFTSSPISFCWPITTNWIDGYSGLRQVVNLVLFENYQDAKIIIGCALLIVLHRTLFGFGPLKDGHRLKSIFRL
jgi:LexA-binding, inner membrane-associated putative hydrolase